MQEPTDVETITESISSLIIPYLTLPKQMMEYCLLILTVSAVREIQDASLVQQLGIYFTRIRELTTYKPSKFIPLVTGPFLKHLILQLRDESSPDKTEIAASLSFINLMLSDSVDDLEENQYRFLKLLNINFNLYLNQGSMLLNFSNKYIKSKEALHLFSENQSILYDLIEWGFKPTVEKQKPLFLLLTEQSAKIFFNTWLVLNYYLTPILEERTSAEILRFNQREYICNHFDHDAPPKDLVKTIQSIVNSYRYTRRVQYGPIDLPPSNIVLKKLIVAILDTDISDIEFIKEEFGFYEIEIPNRFQLLNLPILLKNCDLSGWDTSTEDIQRIYDYLQRSFGIDLHHNLPKEIKNQVLARLHPTLQGAIRFYTLEDHYEDINRLLRGLPSFSDEGSEPKRLIAMLLLASLIATALHHMTLLLHSPDVYPEEKALIERLKISEAESVADSRILPGYRLNDQEELEVAITYSLAEGIINKKEALLLRNNYECIKPLMGGHRFLKRIEYYSECVSLPYSFKNPSRLSTFFSTSTRNGQFLIDKEPTDRKFYHQLLGRFNNEVSISELSERPFEEEVLLRPGLQYALMVVGYSSAENMMIMDSILLRSPEFYRDEYASSAALIHAANYYLDKPYKEESDSHILFGVELHRPNHGIVHTHAVMKYIPMIVSFLSVHAKDAYFRNFCDSISPVDMECLKIIAAFSVTGRESEAQSKSGDPKIANYRKASAKNLRMYLQSLPAPFFSEPPLLVVERCMEITKYFGNPAYESQFNTATNEQEKQKRCYYHRIISLAHTLDLPRCWSIEEFKQAIQYYNNFIINTESWRRDLFQMISHACEWIDKRGDMLNFKVDLNGEYTKVSKDYRINFILNSNNTYLLELKSNKYPSLRFEKPTEEFNHSWSSFKC